MRDGMTQDDHFAIGLSCGHPNVKPGEKCPLCGETLPAEGSKTEETEKSLDQALGE